MALENPFKNMPKPALYVSIAGGLAIGGYALYRHHKMTGSWSPFASGTAGANSAGNPASIDPVTGLAYSDDNATDPLTGQTYLAEAQQYGSVAAAEASVSAFGQSTATGSGIPVNPASPASSGSINTPVGTSVYTSNAAWAQAATAGLADVGYNETDVATALGDYLTQTPVTPEQASLIKVAIAEYGPAPVGNLQVILQPPSKPSGNTGGTAPSVPAAPKDLKITGLHPTSAQVSWDLPGGVHNASWVVENHEGMSNGKVVDNFVTNNTVANLGGADAHPPGLKPGTRYTVVVHANAAKAPSAQVSYTTPK